LYPLLGPSQKTGCPTAAARFRSEPTDTAFALTVVAAMVLAARVVVVVEDPPESRTRAQVMAPAAKAITITAVRRRGRRREGRRESSALRYVASRLTGAAVTYCLGGGDSIPSP
jgi:hypothetical protein